MLETLLARITELRHRVRRVLWLYGLSWVLAVLLGAVTLAGLLDWLLHLDDGGVRLLLGLAILAGSGWVAWRRLVRPLLTRLSDVDVALQIERRYPEFNDSLASTVEFATRHNDPAIGSPELQQAVIRESLEKVSRVDVADVVDTSGAQRVAMVAAVVIVATAMLAGFRSAEAATALRRLVLPFSDTTWPKTTSLRLLDTNLQPLELDGDSPLRVADGTSLQLYVEDTQGRLPADVRLESRRRDQRPLSQQLRQTTLRDDAGQPHEVCVIAIDSVTESLEFRAVGGDDYSMPFRQLEVVSPPVLDELRVRLTPPAYTGRSAEELPPGVGHLQGLLGTRVDIEAVANKPLTSIQLRRDRQPPVNVDLSGKTDRRFRTSFVIDEAGVSTYWFEMADEQGFRHPRPLHYEVRGSSDVVPDVYIEIPASDMLVTSDAEIPLRVVARDDLGLKAVGIRYGFGESVDEDDAVIPLVAGADEPQQLALDYNWSLSELALTQGTRIIFHAEAEDAYDLDAAHLGTSVSRTLTVVSPADKKGEIASRQAMLLEELERIQSAQQRAHDQVGELQTQFEEVGSFRPQDLDVLKRVELDQRRISSQILNPVDGIERRTDELLEELRQNGIEDAEMRGQLERIAEELGVLRESHLPAVEHELTQARKTIQTADEETSSEDAQAQPTAAETGPSLRRAGRHQEQVLASLEDLIGSLSRWHTRNDLENEIDKLVGAQEDLNRSTAEIGRETLTKPKSELTPQERADLARTAKRQRNYAETLQELQSRLSVDAKELSDSALNDPENMETALDYLREQAIVNRMREAAELLEQNRVGQAAEQQQQVLEELRELADHLADRQESDLETLVKKMEQAQQTLEELRQRQEELIQHSDPADDQPDDELLRLQKQQRELRDEVSRLARQLRRLQARQAGESAQRAASRMQQAAEDLTGDERSAADEHQREAAEDLEQAQRELAQAQRQAEEQLARELLERISDEITAMVERQQAVIDETERLDRLRAERGNWTRGQLKSLKGVAETQLGLRDESQRLADSLEAAEVFALAVRGAVREMTTAADRLDARQTDEETLRAQRAARQRFEDLMEALAEDEDEGESPDQDAEQPSDEGGRPQQQPPSETIPQLAQLKMLKTLQQDLVERTERLHEVREQQDSEAVQQQLDALAEEQGQLADLARNLTEALPEESIEDAPTEL